jgi:glycosyltransferase involved in cell wall biosynthesis
MKIAQISPLFESVPPKAYGGTERVVSFLTEELVRLGHEVTLFASGDSVTAAELIAPVDRSIRSSGNEDGWPGYLTLQMSLLAEQSARFDILHFHTGFMHFPLAARLGRPYLTTMHDRLDLAGATDVYRHFPEVPLVSISHSQRRPLPAANWIANVYHGLPADLYGYSPGPGKHFVFLGRLSPDKRVDRAIEIAERCGVPLYIGAKLDKADEAYFNERIKPLFAKPCVHFLGEIGEEEKRELLQGARALLFPIDWPEPFGLVMIEALSCGTPVVAYANGAIPEVLEHGVTGFVVSNQDEAVAAAQRIGEIDRAVCRATFERRFSAAGMACNYLGVYEKILSR